MTHIPAPADIGNATCPTCNTKFGYVVQDDKVTCPACNTAQELPVIMTGNMEYRCLKCKTDFTTSDSAPRCPMCRATWKKQPITT